MPKTTKNDRYNDIFPTRLRGMLKERNATHAALAAVLGVSNQAVSLYCNGGTQPKIEDIAKIARFLDVSTDYLLGLEDDFGNVTVSPGQLTDQLSAQEKELLDAFNLLGPFERDGILVQVKALAKMNKKEVIK